jgi:hypothetical protein
VRVKISPTFGKKNEEWSFRERKSEKNHGRQGRPDIDVMGRDTASISYLLMLTTIYISRVLFSLLKFLLSALSTTLNTPNSIE